METLQTLIYAVSQDTEEALKKTAEIDRLIDLLRHAAPHEEKIESSTDVLERILKPVVDEEEDIPCPPRDPEALKIMEKEITQREQEGQLDEGFLSKVKAQLRQGSLLSAKKGSLVNILRHPIKTEETVRLCMERRNNTWDS
ncbi:hypothetical protein SAY86_011829 [Trapa natans]|uniref:Uncharacterized protein n=1 Tax=Trapa natans TaxID=22666 RepID=A0AAN7RA37_TRANT|nr:hypothetical protein SAY86_011829 [Trapa natans]